MKPEDLAHELNRVGYTTLIETIKLLDPDLFQVIQALTNVRSAGWGRVEIKVQDGKVMMISPTVDLKLR